MTLDELRPLGMNILVFRDDVPYQKNPKYPHYSLMEYELMSEEGSTFIDAKWIASQALGPNADETHFETAYKEARDRYFAHGLPPADMKDEERSQHYKESDRLHAELESRRAEYHLFRPSALTTQIGNADLVIVPRELIR